MVDKFDSFSPPNGMNEFLTESLSHRAVAVFLKYKMYINFLYSIFKKATFGLQENYKWRKMFGADITFL